jgi:hypothetical protein
VAGLAILRVESPASFVADPGHPSWGVLQTLIGPGALAVASGG